MSQRKRDCQVARPRNGMMDPISVLLVDDNATFLRVAARFLQEHCQEAVVVVGTAEGGEEALDLAKDLKPRIILLDLNMPGMSGLETIPRLRQAFPGVGIIALTLLDTESYRSAAITAGADGFVPKAALNLELLPAIKRIIAEYKKRGGLPRDDGGWLLQHRSYIAVRSSRLFGRGALFFLKIRGSERPSIVVRDSEKPEPYRLKSLTVPQIIRIDS